MSQYIKAEALPVFIGNYEFDGIRVAETGEYRMSQSQILEPIGENRNWLSKTVTLPSKHPKELEALKRKGFSMFPLRVYYEKSGTVTRAVTWSLADARIVWRHFDRKGNAMAELLVDLLAEDSLKDRFEQVWDERRNAEQRQNDDCRILDAPEPWSQMFEQRFEKNLERISGLHKCDIRNASLYWEFIYHWLTTEERIKLDAINPVLQNGRRKYKIHACIEQATKDRLRSHIQAVLILMESANSVSELRRLLQRREGFDQGDLFDGWGAA